MNNATSFLNDYISVLRGPFAAGEADHVIADWLWTHRGRVAGAIADLNHAMGLTGNKSFRDHIPTFSVGSPSGLLYVSANPGFEPERNALENVHRCGGIAMNRDFCRNFLHVFPNVVGANGWWTRALKFAYLLQMGIEAPGRATETWAWAAQQQPLPNGGVACVGNVDLIPLHSTADGFGLMNQKSLASNLLRSVALATLQTVLRIEPAPRLILVASSGGAALVAAEAKALGLQRLVRRDNPPYNQFLRQYSHANGHALVTFGRQLFAGNFPMNRPPNFDRTEFATLLRPLAQPPY